MKQVLGNLPGWLVGIAAAVLALTLLILAVQILLVPFVAALFLVYLFEPGLQALQRRGLSRGHGYLILLSISAVVLLVLAVVLAAIAPSVAQVDPLGRSDLSFGQRLESALDNLEKWVHTRLPMFQSVKVAGEITARAKVVATHFIEELPTLLTSFIINLLLVPFIGYFMVRDGRRLRRSIVSLVPNRYFEMALMMFHRIDGQIGGYLRGRLIECMLVGITQMVLMTFASTFIVDQPQILLISAVCGVTNLIPYVGPVLGSAFGVFIYFAANQPLEIIWTLLGVIAVAHLVDNVVIAPAVLSHNVDLHPLTVALVLVIGGEVLGVLGLLIAIPVASTIKVIAQEFYRNYQAVR